MLRCKICNNYEAKSLISHIIRHHKITCNEYKELYSSEVYIVTQEIKDKISKSIKDPNGKYKKTTSTTQYRKNLSNGISTSEKYKYVIKYIRKNRFQTRYWIEKGYTEEEAIKKIHDIQVINSSKIKKRPPSYFSKEYWIGKGYSEEDAIKKTSEVQSNNSSKSKKFKGKKHSNDSKNKTKIAMKNHIYNIGTEKWVGHIISSYRSKAETKLFNDIYLLNNNAKANVFIMGYNVDIIIDNYIIEFFGDFWHCNPLKFEGSQINPVTKKYAHEVWECDNKKILHLTSLGYKVLVVWESEWNNNKDIILNKIKDFLNDKN